MGVVYLARQAKLDRLVALKMILAGGHASDADLARFRTEAEAIARLQHPNIVQVFDVGDHGGLPYFSLEFCGGGGLDKKLNGTPLPPNEAAVLVETLARAMQEAHDKGVIHRDLKPANILLSLVTGHSSLAESQGQRTNDQGQMTIPKITDFGLAKRLDAAGPTATGAMMGTPSYMAPEQAGGAIGGDSQTSAGSIGPAADVYALGAILYECLTGRPPFKAATPIDTVLQVLSKEPVPPRSLVPTVPRDLETICLKCLEKAPARRYASAADLADDLKRWLDTRPIRARRTGPVGRAARWCRRNPVLAAVSAVAAIVIVTLTAVYYASLLNENKRTRDARDQAERERDQAEAARERGLDTLARSLFEQARALRLAHRPGWRWQALDLLREAERLRVRPRRADLPPVEEGVVVGTLRVPSDGTRSVPTTAAGLPGRAELRREAATALLLQDARPLSPITVSASINTYREVSGDGRRVLAAFTSQTGKTRDQSRVGLRLFDLMDGRLLRELPMPNATLLSLAMSPDATTLAVSEPGRMEIQLRDLPDGTPRATLPELQRPAPPIPFLAYRPMVFSPDGRYLAAVATDSKKSDVYLWDLRDSRASRHVVRVDGEPSGLGFRPDGRLLAFPLGGKKIALADVMAPGEPKVVELPLPVAPWGVGSLSSQRWLAWGGPSSLMAVACANAAGKATILFWDADRQTERGRWDGDFDGSSLRMAFSPNGQRLAAIDTHGSIRIYDLAAHAETLRLEDVHSAGSALLQWRADDRLLSADYFGNAYTTWQFSADPLSSVLVPRREGILGLAFGSDGRWLAVLHSAPQPGVMLVERASGKITHQLTVPDKLMPITMRLRPNGRQLALLDGRQAAIWDLPDGRAKTYSMAAPDGWQRLDFDAAFPADGRLLVVDQMLKDNELRLKVRDVVSGKQVGPGITAALGQGPNLVPGVQTHVSADGRLLLVSDAMMQPTREPVSIWDVASGKRVGELKTPDQELAIMMGPSPDNHWLCQLSFPSSDVQAVNLSQFRLRVWDVPRRQRHWDLSDAGAPLSDPVFGQDGRLLAFGYENGAVAVWDVQERELLFRWQAHTGAVRPLAFSPDSAFLAASGPQGPVCLLNLSELRRRLTDMGLGW
jgi:WD40 repeat protein